MLRVAVIGGGAAGFFAALRHKSLFPENEVIIFEKTSKVLGKVKISGGGRCNVTHACYEVKKLVQFYPRGSRELIGPFNRFQPSDTIKWFEDRGVELKTEEDGRMFPVTDQSQTIIDCLMNEAIKLGVRIYYKHELNDIIVNADQTFDLRFKDQEAYPANRLIITTGSNEMIWEKLKALGHQIDPPVPSLFTFNIVDKRLEEFPGVSWPRVEVEFEAKIKDEVEAKVKVKNKVKTEGPMLVTHWGLSGPAILKLSAIGARELHECNYQFKIKVNFIYPYSTNEVFEELTEFKTLNPNKLVTNISFHSFTSRIWTAWMDQFGYTGKTWQNLSKKDLQSLAEKLTKAEFEVRGKSTFKEEFVTCGGVDLKEIDMKTMQSKKIKNLYFAGEVLNIDALTGGFNFQAAWTTGWIAGAMEFIPLVLNAME